VEWKRSNPVYPVADIDASVAWYARTFGFEAKLVNEVYAVLYRNGVSIHLVKKGVGDLLIPGPVQAQFWIDGQLDELFNEVSSRGVKVVQSPADEPWGHRDFMVADPDGNYVWVTIPLTRSSAG
jgi:uncharacterized glyoxalase superfamily protein PhnB